MSYTYNYHQDADILEVFFADIAATASAYLTPDILLHFRVEDRQAVSLIFNNFSHLIRQAEYGPRALQLTVDRWPEQFRSVIWQILAQPPLNEWLAISTYRSPRMRHSVPLAAMRAIPLPVAQATLLHQ
jgi:hypothetical protein